MLFTDVRTEILDRLNYTSTDATTRVGRLINKVYRAVGTAIGMSFTRQTAVTEVVTIGNASVTFSETEKILQVWRLDGSSNPVILSEVLHAELRESVTPSSDKPTKWALFSTTSNGCVIRLNAKPATAYTLYADVIAEVADLSGSNEPAFPESFHDILIEGVLKDEYRKLEKIQLARESERAYEQRLSDLRMFVAKSNYLDIQQGKIADGTTASRAGSGTSARSVTGPTSSTDNAVVRWDGTGGTIIQNSTVIINDTDDITMASTGTLTLPNTGLHLLDSDATHDLIIKPGSNLTVDRTLTVTTADSDRTLTISGNATVSQDYSTAGSPTLTGLTLTGVLAEQGNGTVTGTLTFDGDALHIFDTDASHDLIITPGSNLTADRVLTLTTGDAARTLTISGDATISQDYSTTGSPQFTGLTVTGTMTASGAINFDSDACRLADTNASHYLILTPGSDLTVNRVLTLTTGDSARTVTISGDTTISQDYSTAGSPQFTGVELGHATDTTLTRASAGVIAVEGTNLAKVSNNLSVFAATTSAQLAGVISDETGSGLVVFATSPSLTTPTLTSATIATDIRGQVITGLAGGRLTLTSGTPVTSADVTAAGTLYYTPQTGSAISLYNGSAWVLFPFSEISLALTLTSGSNYDVFLYDNSGTLTLETLVWTDDTTRATALTTQNGVLVKTGALTRRYLGTIRGSASNQTEDSFAKRFVWNYYNRAPRAMRVLETTTTWTYTSATWRQANGAVANQLDFVIGVNEVGVEAMVTTIGSNASANVVMRVGIGLDSTTTVATGTLQAPTQSGGTNGEYRGLTATIRTFPGIGRHTLTWMERSDATGTTTWVANTNDAQSGITGMIYG